MKARIRKVGPQRWEITQERYGFAGQSLGLHRATYPTWGLAMAVLHARWSGGSAYPERATEAPMVGWSG